MSDTTTAGTPGTTAPAGRRRSPKATPGQLGFLAGLFEMENASRAESKRARLLRTGRLPPIQDT